MQNPAGNSQPASLPRPDSRQTVLSQKLLQTINPNGELNEQQIQSLLKICIQQGHGLQTITSNNLGGRTEAAGKTVVSSHQLGHLPVRSAAGGFSPGTVNPNLPANELTTVQTSSLPTGPVIIFQNPNQGRSNNANASQIVVSQSGAVSSRLGGGSTFTHGVSSSSGLRLAPKKVAEGVNLISGYTGDGSTLTVGLGQI